MHSVVRHCHHASTTAQLELLRVVGKQPRVGATIYRQLSGRDACTSMGGRGDVRPIWPARKKRRGLDARFRYVIILFMGEATLGLVTVTTAVD